VIPTLPLRLRNRLASTILAALHDATARHELAKLAGEAGARDWLEGEELRWVDPLAARAQAASAALAHRPLLARDADLGQAWQAAGSLFDAGLYFEVHEVLEPHWAAAGGATREALQGVIQIAVAWQHLANGNVAGARSLFVEGGDRLRGTRLLDVDLDPFARAAREAVERIASGRPAPPPPFPSSNP
jgi:Domain of unknown function (DUF309)